MLIVTWKQFCEGISPLCARVAHDMHARLAGGIYKKGSGRQGKSQPAGLGDLARWLLALQNLIDRLNVD
jgi:hypothetical protein